MAPRAYWTGHLKLSLLSFPVRVYNAITSSGKIQLHQIHKPTGERIRYTKTTESAGPVDPDDIVKGYEYGKGQYVLLDDGDLEKVDIETSKTIDLVQFVGDADLDPIYRDSPYYLAPDGTVAEAAFRVIREALKQTGKVGIGRVVFGNKERIVAIQPRGPGFLLTTLHYAHEVRSSDAFFEDIGDGAIDKDELQLAKQLIQNKTADFDPAQFNDRYQNALHDLVQKKIEGIEPAAPRAQPTTGKVISLMDALKRSIEQSKGEPTPRAPSKRRAADEVKKTKTPSRAKKTAEGGRRKKTA